MNTGKIRYLADKIENRQAALEWLKKNGVHITGRTDRVEAAIKLTPYHGDGDTGYSQAVDLLQSYALIALPELVQQAIKCCENDIVIHRDAIRAELDADNV